MKLTLGILIPFFGTTIGSTMVYFMGNTINKKIEKILLGFAAGVMIAASIWSLIIPAIEMSNNYRLNWFPSAIGFLLGIVFLGCINNDKLYRMFNNQKDKKMNKTIMMVLAVTLHNIPEGMAVGVIFAGALSSNSGVTMAGAFALAIGIAIQNFPEGAIISMPLKSQGVKKNRAFLYGMLSRNSRANQRSYNTLFNCVYFMYFTIFTIICSRSNDVCCSIRNNTRVTRR